MKNHVFTDRGIARIPKSPSITNFEWSEILEIFKLKEYREALFIASPNMYKVFESFEDTPDFDKTDEFKSFQVSLYKYASRLANRCTPFGLWATVSPIKLSSKSSLEISKGVLNRTTKFDMFFLGNLVQEIIRKDFIRERILFFPNNSIYKVMDSFRYVEYYFKDVRRSHKISEVEANDFLDLLLKKSKGGLTINKLVGAIVEKGIDEEDASDFVEQVIEGQFLVHELDFNLTGEDYFEKLISTLSNERFHCLETEEFLGVLKNLKKRLELLDENTYNDTNRYLDIHSFIEDKLFKTDITKLFQVDSSRKIPVGTLGFKILKSLRTAAIVLNKLQTRPSNPRLEEFKRKFILRYEEFEIPLSTALDPDLGIGYGNTSTTKTPLIEHLVIESRRTSGTKIDWDEKKSFLFKKTLKAIESNDYEIVLMDEELNRFSEDDRLYPDSCSFFFSIINEKNKQKIFLNSVVGPSSTRMIGRFSHLDNDINALCEEAHSRESNHYPDCVLAEIVHIPQARTGNILYRQVQRGHEIPYLAKSSLDSDKQIPVQDLMVSVKNGKVVIRSRRLNKKIIPRLGNAHNYSFNALPIYQFLSELQDQEHTGLMFEWGGLEREYKFLPRLTYKNVILSRATWILDQTEIHSLLKSKKENNDFLRTFVDERKLNSIVCFSQGDNEITINFKDELSCEVFLMLIKNEKQVILKEYLFEEATITEQFCNEFMVPAYRKADKKDKPRKQYEDDFSKEPLNLKDHQFSLGEEWMYYKFYCGEQTIEKLLKGPLRVIVEELIKGGLIRKWFFLRYIDSQGSHLRFRLLVNDLQNISAIVKIIKENVKPYEDSLLVWKISTDTYLREIQRYGKEAIGYTETLYNNDSECMMDFLALIDGDSGEKMRWLFSIMSIDSLLSDFGFGLDGKADILNNAKNNFNQEFNRKGYLNKQINSLYKENVRDIELVLNSKKVPQTFMVFKRILFKRSKKNQESISRLKELSSLSKLPKSISVLCLSYIHLICNRIFIGKQRVHEMVVYDMLYKHYKKHLHIK